MFINERHSELSREQASKSFAVGNVLSSMASGGKPPSKYPGPKKEAPIQSKPQNTTFEKQIGPVKPPDKKIESNKNPTSSGEPNKILPSPAKTTENNEDSLQSLQKQLEMLELSLIHI